MARRATTKETKTNKATTKKAEQTRTTTARVSAGRTASAKTTTRTKSATTRRGGMPVESVTESVSETFNNLPGLGIPGLSGRKMSKRTLAIGATLIVLAGLLYLLGRYAIIAWVDNRPITRFQLFSNLEQRYGNDTREQLIVQELIQSEARRKNVNVTDFEIDQEIKKIEEQQGGKEQLDQILQVQGISQPEFRNLIKLQLLRTKIFSEGVNVTDEDVTKYIEENRENIPAATEGASQQDKDRLRIDVREQLQQQQISQKFNQWLQGTLQSERVRRS